MSQIVLQGVDSINDFWCYLNGNRSQAFVASGDGVKQPKIEWSSPDFIEVNVRYGLQDFVLWKIGYDQNKDHERIYIVRDHRQTQAPKYTYYFFGEALHVGYA